MRKRTISTDDLLKRVIITAEVQIADFVTPVPLLLSSQHMFNTHPELIDKRELAEKYPWCNERITYAHVMTSYRRPNFSFGDCIFSLFTIHNELFNCWSHILGAIVAIALFLQTYLTVKDSMASTMLMIYTLGGLFMFCSSTSYHIFCCHSDMICRNVQCLDWSGISIYTFSSTLLVSYFEIYSSPNAFILFTCVNIFLCFLSYFITYSALQKVYGAADNEEDSNIKWKTSPLGQFLQPLFLLMETYTFRTLIAASYALGPLIAWALGYYLTGKPTKPLIQIGLLYSCFATVICCLFDIPEKYLPIGTVDILGYSHQIFHCGIIAGYVLLWSTYYDVALSLPGH